MIMAQEEPNKNKLPPAKSVQEVLDEYRTVVAPLDEKIAALKKRRADLKQQQSQVIAKIQAQHKHIPPELLSSIIQSRLKNSNQASTRSHEASAANMYPPGLDALFGVVGAQAVMAEEETSDEELSEDGIPYVELRDFTDAIKVDEIQDDETIAEFTNINGMPAFFDFIEKHPELLDESKLPYGATKDTICDLVDQRGGILVNMRDFIERRGGASLEPPFLLQQQFQERLNHSMEGEEEVVGTGNENVPSIARMKSNIQSSFDDDK